MESKMILKAFSACTYFLLCISSGFANNQIVSADTTHKTLMASPEKKGEDFMLEKAANIVYPQLFAGNEDESIDYVEKFSSLRKDYLVRTYNKSKKLFPQAEAILKKYHVPQEFKVLLALESGFNANAVSSAGAVGYWQIMDEVAKEYGLKIPRKVPAACKKKSRHAPKKRLTEIASVDERKNFNKSTNAAARYLKDRSRNLNNDWLLIAASYNCGVGNVWNAMERSGKRLPTFWDIRNFLPAETRYYVMNFITLNVIFNNYDAFAANTLCFKDVVCKNETLGGGYKDDVSFPVIE